jgi:general stress protein CsbA
LRGRLMAGYWLFAAVVLFAVVTLAHFVGAFGPLERFRNSA